MPPFSSLPVNTATCLNNEAFRINQAIDCSRMLCPRQLWNLPRAIPVAFDRDVRQPFGFRSLWLRNDPAYATRHAAELIAAQDCHRGLHLCDYVMTLVISRNVQRSWSWRKTTTWDRTSLREQFSSVNSSMASYGLALRCATSTRTFGHCQTAARPLLDLVFPLI